MDEVGTLRMNYPAVKCLMKGTPHFGTEGSPGIMSSMPYTVFIVLVVPPRITFVILPCCGVCKIVAHSLPSLHAPVAVAEAEGHLTIQF